MAYLEEVREKLKAVVDRAFEEAWVLIQEELKNSFKNGLAVARTKKRKRKPKADE